MNELLALHEGKFCISPMTCRYGAIPLELFRSYLRRYVKDRTLAETRDRYGRIWYERSG